MDRYPFPGLALYEATLEAREMERKTFHYYINDFDRDPLAWSMPLDNHHCGQFSMVAVQSNVNMEDHSEVKVGNGALFVGVYDGYKGDAASYYFRNHIFQTLLRHVQENDNNMSLDILRKVVSEIETGFIEFARRHYVQHGQPKIGIVSSGCLICIIERRTLYLANVGDSRDILGSKMGIGPFKRLCVKQMARDDSCNNQNIRDELAALHDDNMICNYNDEAWRLRNTIEIYSYFLFAFNLSSSISNHPTSYANY